MKSGTYLHAFFRKVSTVESASSRRENTSYDDDEDCNDSLYSELCPRCIPVDEEEEEEAREQTEEEEEE